MPCEDKLMVRMISLFLGYKGSLDTRTRLYWVSVDDCDDLRVHVALQLPHSFSNFELGLLGAGIDRRGCHAKDMRAHTLYNRHSVA